MNISEAFQSLAAKYPGRKPGSAGARAVLSLINEQTGSWEFKPVTKKIPVFHYSASIAAYIIGSLAAIGLSMLYPLGGLILEALLFWLLIGDLTRPVLAKIKPGKAENLFLTIPARSKETQKIIIATSFVTDNFTARPQKMANRIFLCIIYGLGLVALLLLAGTAFLKLPVLLFPAMLALLIIIVLSRFANKNDTPGGLTNCSILLELGSILLKARPNTISVTLFFAGANSLNSGMLAIPELLKNGPELAYIINLGNWPDKRINLVTTDGLILPQQSDPLLVEALMEVAKEKAIPLQAIKLSEIGPVYSLKRKKIKTITITNPVEVPDANKNIRELLSGLIRKLDG